MDDEGEQARKEAKGDDGAYDRIVPFRPRQSSRSYPPGAGALPDVAHASFDVEAFARDEIRTAIAQADVDPTIERDRLALRDEQAFRGRFRFKVGKRERAKILAFKRATGVTDGEITLLWWTDSLDTSGHEVVPAASRLKYVRGYALLVVFSLLMLATFSSTIFRPPSSPTKLALSFVAQAALLIAWCAALILDVRPYSISLRLAREARQAKSARADAQMRPD